MDRRTTSLWYLEDLALELMPPAPDADSDLADGFSGLNFVDKDNEFEKMFDWEPVGFYLPDLATEEIIELRMPEATASPRVRSTSTAATASSLAISTHSSTVTLPSTSPRPPLGPLPTVESQPSFDFAPDPDLDDEELDAYIVACNDYGPSDGEASVESDADWDDEAINDPLKMMEQSRNVLDGLRRTSFPVASLGPPASQASTLSGEKSKACGSESESDDKENASLTQRAAAEYPNSSEDEDSTKEHEDAAPEDDAPEHAVLTCGMDEGSCTYAVTHLYKHDRDHLNVHHATRNAQNRYACTYPGCTTKKAEGYKQKCSRNKHVIAAHWSGEFRCAWPNCGKVYAREDLLTRHKNAKGHN